MEDEVIASVFLVLTSSDKKISASVLKNAGKYTLMD